jgi:hypothetical protein
MGQVIVGHSAKRPRPSHEPLRDLVVEALG